MATKITGIGDDGMPTTTGDTGTLVTDGSLVIGNADTDNVTFNADIASNLVPDADDTYRLGSASKAWSHLYISDDVIRKSRTGTGFLTLGFEDPGDGSIAIIVPAVSGMVGLSGYLPSFLTFGRNASRSSPITEEPLTTSGITGAAQEYRLPVNGKISHMSVQCQITSVAQLGNTIEFEIFKNDAPTGKTLTVVPQGQDPTGPRGGVAAYDPRLAVSAGDLLDVRLTLSTLGPGVLSLEDIIVVVRMLN
jgi:hypothetical protein